jgi:hypothetical protein
VLFSNDWCAYGLWHCLYSLHFTRCYCKTVERQYKSSEQPVYFFFLAFRAMSAAFECFPRRKNSCIVFEESAASPSIFLWCWELSWRAKTTQPTRPTTTQRPSIVNDCFRLSPFLRVFSFLSFPMHPFCAGCGAVFSDFPL